MKTRSLVYLKIFFFLTVLFAVVFLLTALPMEAFAEVPKVNVQYMVSGVKTGTIQVSDNEGDPSTDSEGVPYPIWTNEDTGWRNITVPVGTTLTFEYTPSVNVRFLYWNHNGSNGGFSTIYTVSVTNSSQILAVNDGIPGEGVGTLSCTMNDIIDFGTRIQGYSDLSYNSVNWTNTSTWGGNFEGYMFVGRPCFTLVGDDPDAFEIYAEYGDTMFTSRPYGNTTIFEGIKVRPKSGLSPGTYTASLNYTEPHGTAFGTASSALSFKVVESGHTVDVTVKPAGYYGSVTGCGDIATGEQATLTAVPSSEIYEFVRWTKDGATVSTENPYVFTPTEDTELTAEFVQTKAYLFYGVTGASNNATVSVKDSEENEYESVTGTHITKSFPVGSRLTFHCELQAGTHLVYWNVGSNIASCEPDINYTVEAVSQREISAIIDGEPNGADRILTCSMDDIDFGSRLQGYTIGNDDYETALWTNTTVWGANFEGFMIVGRPCFTLGGDNPDAFELYAKYGDDYISSSRPYGNTTTFDGIKVRPKAGLSPGTYTATLNYTEPHGSAYGTASAALSFVVRPGVGANVTISPAEGGTVEGAEDLYDARDTVSLNAVPAEHYVFSYWQEGDVKFTDNPYTYIAEEGSTREITAVFEPETYLTLISLPAEAGIVSGSGWYAPGVQATASASANEGWVFDHWSRDTINGMTVTSTDAEYSFVTVNGPSQALAAVFRRADVETNAATIIMINAPVPGGTMAGISAKDAADPALFTVTFSNWEDQGGIPASEFNYGGNYTADVTLQLSDGFVFSSTAIPQVSGGGSFSGFRLSDDAKSIIATYTIAFPKMEPNLSDFELPTDLSRSYNGAPQTVNAPTTEKTGMGIITVKYDGETTAPKYPGTYAVTFDIEEGYKYTAKAGLVIGTLTIAPDEDRPVHSRSRSSGTETVNVEVNKTEGKVSVEGNVSSSMPLLVASYDENGRFLGVSFMTSAGETDVFSGADAIKVLWIDNSDATPQCEAVDEALN